MRTTVEIAGAGVTLAADRWAVPDGTEPQGYALLLHGGGQTRHSWRTTGARLAASGWNALAVDTRGHGDSEWPSDGDYGTEALIADLHAVIATSTEKPVLIGASMGGMTSLIALGEDSTIARGLVLVDIVPQPDPDGIDEIIGFMQSGLDGFETLDHAAAAIGAYSPSQPRRSSIDGLRKNLRLREGRWYWHWDPRLLSESNRAEKQSRQRYLRACAAAAAIRVPTLLVRGSRSHVVSHEGADELLSLIPSAQRIDIADASHMIAGDDNDQFRENLLSFLEREFRQNADRSSRV
ncbi:alpha/beta fold hydrolase [Rhodococcus koreensis]|uniref:alpha/beta fold hydrolase n=1 Tax=Rhodococcus koreensis TaxID=99653 RepID=UPI00366EAEB7